MNSSEIILEENKIYGILKEVIDPELMVNIVDLGLVYEVQISIEKKNIIINHTLTSRGCPMGDIIFQNIEEVLKQNYPEYNVLIQLVWEPSWNFEMVSEEGKLLLTTM
jgi:metal-sulfur cluster biosynthetic enzyme